MHLKNWSLIYRGDGGTPALAPLYDVLSTIPYLPADSLALSLGGERSFKALTADRWNIRDPAESYAAFRGRTPTADALLRNRGLD